LIPHCVDIGVDSSVLYVVLDSPLLLLVLCPLHASKVPAHRLLVLIQAEISATKNEKFFMK
jgi:hypothetical protein